MKNTQCNQYNRFGWKLNNQINAKGDFRKPIRAGDWKKEQNIQKKFITSQNPSIQKVDGSDLKRYLQEIIQREIAKTCELRKSASEETLTETSPSHLDSTVKFIKTIADIDKFLTMGRRLQDLESKLDILLRVLNEKIFPQRIPVESESKIFMETTSSFHVLKKNECDEKSTCSGDFLRTHKQVSDYYLTRQWMLDIFLAQPNILTKYLNSVPIMQWCPPYPWYLMRNIGFKKKMRQNIVDDNYNESNLQRDPSLIDEIDS